MPHLFMVLLAVVAVLLAVAGVYSFLADLFLRDRSRVGRRVDEEFRKKQRDQARKATLFKNLPQMAGEAASDDDPSLRRRFEVLVEQSGLETTPVRVLGISAALGVCCGLLVTLLRASAPLGFLVGLMAATVPTLYLVMQRQRRLAKLQSQLPEAFELMARVIRAGQTMSQALQAVADDFEKPISAEFSYCSEQQNLGLPPDLALRDLARRTGLLEMRIFVLALLIQQQTGGNLAELLDKLSAVMRDRTRIKGRIRTLTAEGRLQALVLLALPIFLMLVIMLLNPDYAGMLLEHPRLIVGMLISEAFGALWIRRIVNFDF